MKIIFWSVGVIAVLIGGFFALSSYIYDEKQAIEEVLTSEFDEVTFLISGRPISLIEGYDAIESAPGSASLVETRYFGNVAEGDFTGDGVADKAFLVTQETGGSGTFFYLVGAVTKDAKWYMGTQAVLIGDRIAPQTTEIKDGLVIVNYAERAPGEPMTSRPSVGKSLYLKYSLENNDFGEVVKDFEGEANPASMSLGMKTWTWMNSKEENVVVKPKKADAFTLTFTGTTFSATTDCNSMSGSFTSNVQNIDFGAITSTKMYCEGSQESQFASMLERAETYQFTSKGELILMYAGNTATFR